MSHPEADAEKELGNAAYKKKDFDTAIQHYKKAIELNDADPTYLNNLAAVYLEQGKYDECVETCQNAVDKGRDVRADYKIIAKAFGRIGTAYLKKGDYENAVKFFQKSLTEHRTPDVLTKLREAEKSRDEAARQAYIKPELADKAREEGNALFKAGDFAGSVKSYTEAIKRNPSDPKGYTNRAAAYTKLLALSDALKDAEKAIQVDPSFVKGYIRKANVRFGMKEYNTALEALDEAEKHDEGGKNATEISQTRNKTLQAMMQQRATETPEETLQRAMRDPEVASIMQDPVLQKILQDAQSNPASLMDHIQNPQIMAKIRKLEQAGILRLGPS